MLYNIIMNSVNNKDIDTFLNAKKQQLKMKSIFYISVILFTLYLVFKIEQHHFESLDGVALALYVFILVNISEVFPRMVVNNITRADLLSIIENSINNDVEALECISKKRANNSMVKSDKKKLVMGYVAH